MPAPKQRRAWSQWAQRPRGGPIVVGPGAQHAPPMAEGMPPEEQQEEAPGDDSAHVDKARAMLDWVKADQNPDRPDNPPAWVTDEPTWERAKQAAEGTDAEDYWALVSYIYQQMGGGVG